MGTGCEDNSNVSAIVGTCDDQYSPRELSRRLQRWSIIKCIDAVTQFFFGTGDDTSTAEFIEQDGIFGVTGEQDINGLAYHSFLD